MTKGLTNTSEFNDLPLLTFSNDENHKGEAKHKVHRLGSRHKIASEGIGLWCFRLPLFRLRTAVSRQQLSSGYQAVVTQYSGNREGVVMR